MSDAKPKRIVNAGTRIARSDVAAGERVVRVYNKLARRLVRAEGRIRRSRPASAILEAQRDRAEVCSGLSNGHEMRRLVAAEAAHRRAR